jgi:predicted outer membrane repeat protein
MKKLLKLAACTGMFAAVCLTPRAEAGVIYDLSKNSTAVIGGAIFTTDFTQPTGTGVFDPFLSIQANGTEQGYNTSAGVMDTKREPQYNHEIRVSDLNAVYIGSTQYYSFLIDINEPNGGPKSLISLDMLQIYTSTKAGQTTTNLSELGTLRYSLDVPTDSYIRYDDANSGSGQGDIAFFIPVSYFAGASSSDYVYMYQKWGTNLQANTMTQGGFEETAIYRITAVPEVSSFAPLAGVLGMVVGVTHFRRRRTAKAA